MSKQEIDKLKKRIEQLEKNTHNIELILSYKAKRLGVISQFIKWCGIVVAIYLLAGKSTFVTANTNFMKDLPIWFVILVVVIFILIIVGSLTIYTYFKRFKSLLKWRESSTKTIDPNKQTSNLTSNGNSNQGDL